MPRLLPADALHGPQTRARWTAILAAALALTAWNTDWGGAWDIARGLAPTASESHYWDAEDLAAAPKVGDLTDLVEGIDDPADSESAELAAEGMVLDLVWEAPLEIAQVRVETYTDAYGTGHRLAIAADSTTAVGTHCLGAYLVTTEGQTTVQTCSRADRHATVNQEAGKWYPDKLFITQTANVDPANYLEATQVDYFGLGLDIGASETTGVWGPNWWLPMMGDQYHGCNDPDLYLALNDLHLRPEYADPTAHTGDPTTLTHGPVWAAPAPDSLVIPACIPIYESFAAPGQTGHAFAAEPFQKSMPTALTGWTRYNAAKAEPSPLRTALVLDIRSCDTEAAECTSDNRIAPRTANSGVGSDWMSEILTG